VAIGVVLSLPQTKIWLNGYEVDFFWPELKLVVETDGLRYHRTPAAQARDVRRDHAHTAAGFTRLRFTHWQVKYERGYVKQVLRATASRRVHAQSALPSVPRTGTIGPPDRRVPSPERRGEGIA
jgi:hypothetical protein